MNDLYECEGYVLFVVSHWPHLRSAFVLFEQSASFVIVLNNLIDISNQSDRIT